MAVELLNGQILYSGRVINYADRADLTPHVWRILIWDDEKRLPLLVDHKFEDVKYVTYTLASFPQFDHYHLAVNWITGQYRKMREHLRKLEIINQGDTILVDLSDAEFNWLDDIDGCKFKVRAVLAAVIKVSDSFNNDYNVPKIFCNRVPKPGERHAGFHGGPFLEALVTASPSGYIQDATTVGAYADWIAEADHLPAEIQRHAEYLSAWCHNNLAPIPSVYDRFEGRV